MSNQHWSDRDLAVLWHPCTQMRDHEAVPPIPIRRGKGVWLEDFAGNRYLDAVREVLRKHNGLWFYDESYVISRRRD